MITNDFYKISAIIPNEIQLEQLVHELIETAVDRHDISIQGTPEDMAKTYGVAYVDPDMVQHSTKAPTREPFLNDDFGWVLAFTFSLPVVIGVIIGIFVVGDLFSVADNFLYGVIGGVIGIGIGTTLFRIVKKRHDKKNTKQEEQGGFVIWVQFSTDDKKSAILALLQKYHAEHIEVNPVKLTQPSH